LHNAPDYRETSNQTTPESKQPDPFESGCSNDSLLRLSPDPAIAGRGFDQEDLNNPCRPFRPVALEEFFPFQESP
jgi:hypothetical protein